MRNKLGKTRDNSLAPLLTASENAYSEKRLRRVTPGPFCYSAQTVLDAWTEQRKQQARDLSAQAVLDEKTAIREYQKRLENLYTGEYTDHGKIYVQQELKSFDSSVIAPIKDYYNSIEKTGPFEFQIVVDSPQEMTVHTIRHIGKMAVDLAEMVTMVAGAVASASTTPATGIAGAYYAFRFLGGFAMAGVSFVSEIGETINDIAAFNREGCVISTVSPLSDPGEYVMWIAMGVGDE